MTVFSIRWRRVAATILFAFACGATAFAQERRVYAPPDLSTVRAITAEHGLVVAQERIAAQIGADILRQGGNAVDAAVATGFALAVTYPRAGNIGGGGFMVIHSTARNEDAAIDYRETAPAAITQDVDQLQSFAVIDSEFFHFVRRTLRKWRETAKPEVRPEFTNATRHQISVFVHLGCIAQANRSGGIAETTQIQLLAFHDGLQDSPNISSVGRVQLLEPGHAAGQVFDQFPFGWVALLRGKSPQRFGDRREIQFPRDDAGQRQKVR